MALSKDTALKIELGDTRELPVAATAVIYEGSAVGLSSGYARALVAGDKFAGFAIRKADNSAGSNGAINVRVRRRGAAQLAVTGVVAASVGAKVYASDDGTFTLTATNNSLIGVVDRVVSSGVAVVRFDASMLDLIAA